MKKNQIDIITMGCSKNFVDSQSLQKLFQKKGYDCVVDAEKIAGETVVINTCGFIGDAKEESINTILEMVQAKEEGRIKHLYVMGCLSERYKNDLQTEIPQVDRYYGKFDFRALADDIEREGIVEKASMTKDNATRQAKPYYSYIKISEGCDRHCAYCAIPMMTGRHRSRAMDDILNEVRGLVAQGIREFQVIAQELTYYGIDIDGKRHIAELISRMADIEGVRWIRLHYAYPNGFPEELLDVMREKDTVCKYLDIALQHISTSVLDRMRRNTTREETMELIEKLRQRVPGIAIRTTLMVGYPGETDEEFNELVAFVKWARFDCMGAFTYSEEEGTYSAEHFNDDVPAEVKQQRLDKLMRVQQRISKELQEKKIGQTMTVVIDRREGDWYVGRTEFSSPEVDPEVLIPCSERRLRRGCYYDVEITGAEEFDLYGKVKQPSRTNKITARVD